MCTAFSWWANDSNQRTATRGAGGAYAAAVPRVSGTLHCLVRSEFFLKLVTFEFAVLQDLHHETSPDSLAPMNRNNCAASVGMLEKVVTAPDSDYREPHSS